MKTLIVSLDIWHKCFRDIYMWDKPESIQELLLERYGIEQWTKLNENDYRLTFVDDVKMTFWLLKWT